MLNLVVFVTLAKLATCLFDKELHDNFIKMPRSEFVKHFNEQEFSWKMIDYEDDFFSKHHACSYFNHEAFNNLTLRTHGLEVLKDLPESFDSREKWHECKTINEILDQADCGSCWAFGTATTASDRTCIHKKIEVRLSEQDLECSQDNVCGGGDPMNAFEFWQSTGLVTQECKPYDIKELLKNKCTRKCVDSSIHYAKDKHFAEKVYRISNEVDQIKAELVTNGPIQAAFTVYEDFRRYHKGVYEHTTGGLVGGHSVRIVGYGVEDGKTYWLVANSWGNGWGENGWFRIRSYQQEIAFENYLISGIPKN